MMRLFYVPKARPYGKVRRKGLWIRLHHGTALRVDVVVLDGTALRVAGGGDWWRVNEKRGGLTTTPLDKGNSK